MQKTAGIPPDAIGSDEMNNEQTKVIG